MSKENNNNDRITTTTAKTLALIRDNPSLRQYFTLALSSQAQYTLSTSLVYTANVFLQTLVSNLVSFSVFSWPINSLLELCYQAFRVRQGIQFTLHMTLLTLAVSNKTSGGEALLQKEIDITQKEKATVLGVRLSSLVKQNYFSPQNSPKRSGALPEEADFVVIPREDNVSEKKKEDEDDLFELIDAPTPDFHLSRRPPGEEAECFTMICTSPTDERDASSGGQNEDVDRIYYFTHDDEKLYASVALILHYLYGEAVVFSSCFLLNQLSTSVSTSVINFVIRAYWSGTVFLLYRFDSMGITPPEQLPTLAKMQLQRLSLGLLYASVQLMLSMPLPLPGVQIPWEPNRFSSLLTLGFVVYSSVLTITPPSQRSGPLSRLHSLDIFTAPWVSIYNKAILLCKEVKRRTKPKPDAKTTIFERLEAWVLQQYDRLLTHYRKLSQVTRENLHILQKLLSTMLHLITPRCLHHTSDLLHDPVFGGVMRETISNIRQAVGQLVSINQLYSIKLIKTLCHWKSCAKQLKKVAINLLASINVGERVSSVLIDAVLWVNNSIGFTRALTSIEQLVSGNTQTTVAKEENSLVWAIVTHAVKDVGSYSYYLFEALAPRTLGTSAKTVKLG